jgi:ATP-dependent DNA helicase RecQ
VAVIARQWETLNPVRAWCELNGVQVQVARDSHFSVWSLRETQVLVSWLLSKKQVLIGDAELDDWLLDKPDGHWWDIIKTAIIEYLAESAGAKLPPSHLLEWLAEYCRDIRRQQQGLLLTTTHGAKGLEFDHVAILDGGWHDRSSREDHDAPRRLFYVAMTRASQGLLIARQSERPNPFLTELRDKNYVVERAINQTTPIPVELGRIYQSVSLRDVDLGFAGRFNAGHQVHGAINELQPGDPLSLSRHRGRWYLLDEKGREVSRMSTAYVFPTDKQFVHGCITAILRRSRDQTHPDWAHTFSVDEWEVVVPELVFAPG